MTSFLLYHDNSCESGRALARELGIDSGKTLDRKVNSLIRWGNRMQIPRKPDRVLNKMEAMNNASNKDRSLQIMRENDIPHAPIKTVFEGKLLLARKPSHMGGSGCYFITSQYDFNNAKRIGCTSFVEFIPSIREFRVHIINSEPVFVYERVLPPNPGSLNIRNQWNEVRLEVRDTPREILNATIKCVETMGLNFGAVDVGLSVNNRPYIYEVNTAPGLVDGERKKPSFAVYETAMRRWLDEE